MDKVNFKDFMLYARSNRNIGSPGLGQYVGATTAAIKPLIYEEKLTNSSPVDIFSRLLMDRIVFLGEQIDDYVANAVIAQLLYLQGVDDKADISLYINSPGGYVSSGLAIYDTMQFIAPDVATVCVGMAASMGSVLLCAGAAGKRYALKHSRIMIHQPMGYASGQASDMMIEAREIERLRGELYGIIANHSGQSYERVATDADRNFWMSAESAKEYGMIDCVMKGKEDRL